MEIERKLRELDYALTDDYHKTYDESKYKINCDYLKINVRKECFRDRLVHFLPMLPLLKESVPLKDADYILYAHPYARVQDFSDTVLWELHHINEVRKENSELIIVGKATNIKDKLPNCGKKITYIESYYPEILGKKFGLDLHTDYIVYDDEGEELKFDSEGHLLNFSEFTKKSLCIWPVNGCLNHCGFCRETYMNIPFYSIPLEEIKEELDYYKNNEPWKLFHINLRAENLTQYGIDLYGKPMLDKLIDLISSYDNCHYISIPIGMDIGEINDDILNSLCQSGKLRYIALNLEAGSNRLLKLINKPHTREKAIEVYSKLRETYPELVMASTMMIGLPTETSEDIYELADLIHETGPDDILINFYGLSKDQPLAKLPQLDKSVKNYHMNLLEKLLKTSNPKRDLRISSQRILNTNKRKDLIRSLRKKGVKGFAIQRFIHSTEEIKNYEFKACELIPKERRYDEDITIVWDKYRIPGEKPNQLIKKK